MVFRDGKRAARYALALAVVALAVPGFSGLSTAVVNETDSVAPWTIALYICADNNLEACYDQFTLPFLLALPDSEDVNIVAWVDRLSTTGYEVIEFSGEDTVVTEVKDELGFGLASTFSSFLVWADTGYPSENLAVVMWDHGSPWRGFSSDDTDGSRMYGPDFNDAVNDAGVYMDVLGFDACSMSSMERMYEVGYSEYVGIVVASEELVPGNGFPYDLQFQPVVDDADRSPRQLAEDMILGWEAYWDQSQRVNLAAIDMDTYWSSLDEFDAWAANMIAGKDTFRNAYNHALKDAYTGAGTLLQIDILDFAQLLYEELGRYPASQARTALADSTLAFKNALGPSVIALSTSAVTRDSLGLTVWWGWGSMWDTYESYYCDTLMFSDGTGWDEFLKAFNS